ncbi:ash family protein [Salmonella enterica]|nr:ash family protein [Salmonella enterica]EIN2105780.1 ash family protein [Salmonella enterica]EIO8761795.1 ash family protein [Salmonella enterica]EIO8780296.1 ash family protein [Salmonella enterica]
MMNAVLENRNNGRYITPAPHKTGAGIGTPMFTKAHNRASAVFLRAKHCLIRIMVGRAGQPKGWPGSLVTGSSNPVRLTTHEIGTSGGELIKFTKEAAIMATTPTPKHPKSAIPQLSNDCCHKVCRAHGLARQLYIDALVQNDPSTTRFLYALSYIEGDIRDIREELISLGLFDRATGKLRRK